MMQEEKTLCEYQYSHDIETLLHSAGVHHEGRKPYQADNQMLVLVTVMVSQLTEDVIQLGYWWWWWGRGVKTFTSS